MATVMQRRFELGSLLRWIAAAFLALVLLIAVILLGLNTAPGRGFLARQIGGYTTASGISIHAAKIEGSIYGKLTILGLEVRDTQGAFLTAPRVDLDWRPFAYLHKHIDVRSVSAATLTLLRSPALKATPPSPNAPLLPDIDLSLGHLQVDALTIEPPVDGKRHILHIAGSAAIASGRAQIDADAGATAAPGVAGGDMLHLKLDAVPKDNRLLVDVKLAAPRGGLVDSYAGLGKSLAISLDGKGDWANWHGALKASAGATPLADIALTGANGQFSLHGRALPNAILAPGAATRLTSPEIDLDGTTTLGERKADVKLIAHSQAFAVEAQGGIDLADNSLHAFHVDAQLLTPGAIAPAARGRDVRLAAVLDGPFRTPTIDYRLSAATLGFNAMTIEGLAAQGRATIDATHVLVPVSATAQRVTGLNAAAGGLLIHLRADGSFAYSNGKLVTDGLKLRSDRIDATAIAIADFDKGRYTGALKGRVNDYQIDGIGRVNLQTDAHLVPGRNGGFGIAGWVRANTRKLDNASVRDFLGGNALVTANVGYSAEGVATVKDLRVTAPAFRLAGGAGSYAPNGAIAFRATGNSTAYGPIAVIASGTAAKPLVRLHADRPNLGLQLADVDATLVGNGAGGYEVKAKGGSAYGPFSADFVIGTGKGPTRLGIRSAQFAGVNISGAIAQTPAGPFAGTLALAGSGLSGQVRLGAAGKVQRGDIDLVASNAKLPGPMAVSVGAGTVHASAILYPNAPAIAADVRLTDLRYGALIVTGAQSRVRYQNGRGTVALVANGHGSVPFSIAAQAVLDPSRILVNAKGSVNGLAFRLASPATLTKQGADWQLAGATILLPQGQVKLSGRYGAHPQLHAELANLDLSIVPAAMPGLGLGGKASGTIDFAVPAANAMPVSRARIDVTGFTRTGALVISDPLDLSVLATTGAGGATVGALIRRSGTTVGRVQARLGLVGGGASWVNRLMTAPLAGGIRYAGPAELLWTLTGVAGQEVNGPIAIAADFGGRANAPTLNGVVRASQLRYENDTYGTVISNIAIDGRFSQSQFVLNSFSGKAGDGSVAAKGSASLDATQGYPIDIAATLDNARLAKSDALGATVSGRIAITNSKAAGGLIKGAINLGEVRYEIVRQGAAEVPELTGVHKKGASLQPVSVNAQGPAPSKWKLDLRVRAPDRLYVSGMGLESEWSTDMRVGGTAGAPVVVGQLQVVRGTFSFAGKRLDLDNQSKVTFDGGTLTNPTLDIRASTTVDAVTAEIDIGGRAQKPQITLTSTPSLPQDEILSRLLFGSSVTTLSPTEAVQLAAALNSLRGSGGGFSPLGKLRSVAGFDRLRVLGANPATGQGTSVAAGKYIAKNVYVEVVTDTRGFTATQLEVALSKALSVLSSTGSFGGSDVSLRYRKEYR
ncbi:MAG: translocation/assembly module TamB domain-containing protein [Sphingomonadaceae bacterium]|nr:translocation/assembly module TamB domain-containing protein [Sphingomonadaceae bacterium]